MSESLSVYEGEKPYIFISYSHADKERVYPVIRFLNQEHFHIWFDSGISAGAEWQEVIAEHLDHCDVFIAFLTDSFMQSHHCKMEFNFAVTENKKMFCVILEDISFNSVMKMHMASIQVIRYFDYASDLCFREDLANTPLLSNCQEKTEQNLGKKKTFFLERNFTKENIYILHDIFKIGRKEELCDYAIKNNITISKIHAIFYVENNECFIVDYNSKTKVSINGEEILPEQKIKLSDGDFILLGNEPFIYRTKTIDIENK